MFVAIEGIDGTGKTTVCSLVAELLRARGLDVTIKPEFPEGKLSEEFRSALNKGLFLGEHLDMPPAAAFFYLAYAQVVSVSASAPADITLCDRYLQTLALYQSHFVPTVPRPNALALYRSLDQLFRAFGLPVPEVVFLLEASLDVVSRRLTAREGRRPSSDEELVLLQFQETYRDLCARGSSRHFSIDAERKPREVAHEIAERIVILNETRTDPEPSS